MSRYADAFATAKAAKRALFMPYLPAGYPSPAETIPLVKALVAGGADAIELGVPFSDPLADGPTIQCATTIALQQGTTMRIVLESVRRLRADGVVIPITLMGYLNTFLAYGGDAGPARLARDAAAAGADGVIIVDLPPEESDDWRTALRAADLDLIYLLAPTSTPPRIRAVAERASGFVYLVSVTGVTGARDALPPDLEESVRRVKADLRLPLAVGFGISTWKQVQAAAMLCDAVVVGSALVQVLESAPPDRRLARAQEFVQVVTGRRSGEATP